MSTGELHREVYTHGYSPRVAAYMAARTATHEAGFLLPYLHTGMRVLDCGCGPGTITMDLARIVAPGQVEGIDIGETQIASAEAGALERGLPNVHFQVGTVCELPFPAGSFDVVFANAVIQHLTDPLRALREMRRVLAPGGMAALRDDDWGATLHAPTTASLEFWTSLMIKVWTHNGGDPFVGRKHRQLLNAAGFSRTQASSSTESHGSPDATSTVSAVMEEHHRAPEFVRVVLERGWADQGELDDMYRAIRAWGQRDDAFLSLTFCESLAWKPQTESSAPPAML